MGYIPRWFASGGLPLVALLCLYLTQSGIEGRPSGEDGRVRFFFFKNFTGGAHKDHYTPGCHELPSMFIGESQSLNTGGPANCIRVFSESGCEGESKEFTGPQEDLEDWSDKVKSWERCVTSQIEDSQQGRVTFFILSDFEGSQNIDTFSAGCHDLPNYFAGNTESLKTGGNCIKAFKEAGCSGVSREFSGDNSQLGMMRNGIKSWQGCSFSTTGNETQEAYQTARVRFFMQQNFQGSRHIEPITAKCHEIPRALNANTESLNAGESCVRVFELTGCVGESKEYSGFVNDLKGWNNKIRSWEGCSEESIAAPTFLPRESRVSFFYRKNFEGPEHMTNYSADCHDLPSAFIGNMKSVHTHGKCVRVYKDVGCAGGSKDYYPGSASHNDLGEWNDKVKSWAGCPTPNTTETTQQLDGIFRFFTLENFRGNEYKVNYTSGCHDLPAGFIDNTRSINTHGKCVRAYKQLGCAGASKEYEPGTPYPHHNLQDWNDRIKSWETCSNSATVNTTQFESSTSTPTQNGQMTFYYVKDFEGREYSVNFAAEGCHELPSNFRGDTQSLKTGGHCIRVFSLGECSGESTEFSGTRSNLGSWNDKIRSWESCEVSNRTILPQEGRVTFFYKTNFKGREHTARDVDTGCHDLPSELRADSSSLRTGGNCIRGFTGMGCTGRKKEFSGVYENLQEWKDKIVSWESCAVPRRVPEEAEIIFFLLKDFSGPSHIDSYTAGCHDIPGGLEENTQSLKTSNQCIKVFSRSRCSGVSKEFSSDESDLEEWNDRISSWRPCERMSNGTDVTPTSIVPSRTTERPHPHFGGVSFFEKIGYKGSSYVDNYTPGCHPIMPFFRANIESLNTDSKCVKVFQEMDCAGEGKEFYPGAPNLQDDLKEWNQKIKSWQQCQTSSS